MLLKFCPKSIEPIRARRSNCYRHLHDQPVDAAPPSAAYRCRRFARRYRGRSRLNRSGLKAGTPAPNFRLPRIDEGELSLAEFRGGQVLLVFSDPNCGPCDELAPRLQEIHLQQAELQVLVVSRRGIDANRAKATIFGARTLVERLAVVPMPLRIPRSPNLRRASSCSC